MRELAEQLEPGYRAAEPFPHAVIDEFLPSDVVRRIAGEFPSPESIAWRRADRYVETKLSTEDEEAFPLFTRQVMYAFNSSIFTEFLETLTGIRGLIPDPHFRGGGLHQIRRSGKLGVHADFNYYERLGLHRRINALLYLNDEWKEEYGGHLEFWDREMKHRVQRVAPILNRCVIFNTTDDSFHGHPEPLQCPESVTRKSLAFYYYSADRPKGERSAPHTTLFRKRPGETAPAADFRRQRLETWARRILPKGVISAIQSARALTRRP